MAGWTVWALWIAVVAILAVGFIWYLRSFGRWKQPPPGHDPESQEAEARLWATKSMDQR